MAWELARLSDSKWSVRADGKEVWILPEWIWETEPSRGIMEPTLSDRMAREIERMLNTIPIVECGE